jgi:class 3 adenylate cyclase
VGALLYGGKARELRAPDYPWGETEAEALRAIAEERGNDPSALVDEFVRSGMPTGSTAEAAALTRMIRQSASPGALEALDRMNIQIDIRQVLPTISVPTLVLHNTRDRWVDVDRGRDLARRIPGAAFVQFPIDGHLTPAADLPSVLDATERFLEDVWETAAVALEPDRVLATVMFTDIVGSTETAADVGDARWRELLERHHALIRRELMRARGKEVDTADDGFFAAVDGPARGIRAITESMKELGLDVRVGLHTGECELIDGKIAGIGVHIGARVAAKARRGEVLVSSTVKDLVAGSGLRFEDCGAHHLAGIPGEWRLYSVVK